MIPLDDPRWAGLQGNYTDGRRTAALLRQVLAGAPLDAWYDDLFQELCHQYTISEAAYAAIPYLVSSLNERLEDRTALLVLVGACRAASLAPDAVSIPDELSEAWGAAIGRALPLAAAALASPTLTANELRYLLSTVAALQGHGDLANWIEAGDGEIN